MKSIHALIAGVVLFLGINGYMVASDTLDSSELYLENLESLAWGESASSDTWWVIMYPSRVYDENGKTTVVRVTQCLPDIPTDRSCPSYMKYMGQTERITVGVIERTVIN